MILHRFMLNEKRYNAQFDFDGNLIDAQRFLNGKWVKTNDHEKKRIQLYAHALKGVK